MTRPRVLVLTLGLAVALPPCLAAQQTSAPAWTTAWSPLGTLADLPRGLPYAPPLADLLRVPAPRVGLLWTAGAPAGMALDATDLQSGLTLDGAGTSGAYRRQLDPQSAQSLNFAGSGWGPLGDRDAVMGRVVGGQTNVTAAGFSDIAQPFTSDPFVPTDTVSPSQRSVAVRMEGGFGRRLGAWTMGLAVGTVVASDHSVNAQFPRLAKRSLPGVSLGISHPLPFGIRLAATGRWTGDAETVLLPAPTIPGVVYVLEGYEEPDPRAVPHQQVFFARINGKALAGGLAASGTLWGAHWTLFGRKAHRQDDHYYAYAAYQPPTDHWYATQWTWGGAVQRAVFGRRLLATGTLRYDGLHGNATRADLTGDIYRATEHALDLNLDLRWATRDSVWRVALTGLVHREHRVRNDFLLQLRTDVIQWNPGVGVALARALGRNAVGLAYSVGFYSAAAGIPDPTTMGATYQRVLAVEDQLTARRALPMAASLTLERHASATTAVLLVGRIQKLAAMGTQPALTLVPSGDRVTADVSFGVRLTGR